jgi:hypothetical protein
VTSTWETLTRLDHLTDIRDLMAILMTT